MGQILCFVSGRTGLGPYFQFFVPAGPGSDRNLNFSFWPRWAGPKFSSLLQVGPNWDCSHAGQAGPGPSWKIRRRRYEPHFAELHTGPASIIMAWSGIMFDRRTPLIHTDSNLITDRNIIHVMEPVVLPLLQVVPKTVLEQDRTRSHITRRTLKNLTEYDIRPWQIDFPDLNPIERL